MASGAGIHETNTACAGDVQSGAGRHELPWLQDPQIMEGAIITQKTHLLNGLAVDYSVSHNSYISSLAFIQIVVDPYIVFCCTQIMASTNSTNRNPKYFRDPEKFDPSHFEGAGPAPYTFVPFGGGPRMCPGNEFARMEILVLIHCLVTRFSWALQDPDELISFDPLPLPVKGLPILLKPRIP